MTTASSNSTTLDRQDILTDQNVTVVKGAAQAKLRGGLGLLLEQVENEIKEMPEARAIAFSRKDLLIFLDDLIYDGLIQS